MRHVIVYFGTIEYEGELMHASRSLTNTCVSQCRAPFKVGSDPKSIISWLILKAPNEETYSLVYLSKYRAICEIVSLSAHTRDTREESDCSPSC